MQNLPAEIVKLIWRICADKYTAKQVELFTAAMSSNTEEMPTIDETA